MSGCPLSDSTSRYPKVETNRKMVNWKLISIDQNVRYVINARCLEFKLPDQFRLIYLPLISCNLYSIVLKSAVILERPVWKHLEMMIKTAGEILFLKFTSLKRYLRR